MKIYKRFLTFLILGGILLLYAPQASAAENDVAYGLFSDSGAALVDINSAEADYSNGSVPAYSTMGREFTLTDETMVEIMANHYGGFDSEVYLLNANTNSVTELSNSSYGYRMLLEAGKYALCIKNLCADEITGIYSANVVSFKSIAKDFVSSGLDDDDGFVSYDSDEKMRMTMTCGNTNGFTVYNRSSDYSDVNNVKVIISDTDVLSCTTNLNESDEMNITLKALKPGVCTLQVVYHDIVIERANVDVKKLFYIDPESLVDYKKISVMDNGNSIDGIEVSSGIGISLDFIYKDEAVDDESEISYASNSNKSVIYDMESSGFSTGNEGTAVITYKYKNNEIKFYVKVNETKFSLNKDYINLRYGKTTKVSFSRDGKKQYVYPKKVSISNKKIIDYDENNFKITAKAAGTSIITFTTPNNQELEYTVIVPKFNLQENIKNQVAYSTELSQTYNDRNGTFAYVGLQNVTKKVITYVEYSVFQYDNKGSRINKYDSDFTYDHDISKGAMVNVYVSSHVRKYHTCIKKVYYSDDTTWVNPYYDDWVSKYRNKY